MLKPYLETGAIRFIGSTTYDEYNRYFCLLYTSTLHDLTESIFGDILEENETEEEEIVVRQDGSMPVSYTHLHPGWNSSTARKYSPGPASQSGLPHGPNYGIHTKLSDR